MTYARLAALRGPAVQHRSHDCLRLATLCALAALVLDWATKGWALGLPEITPLGALILGVAHNDAFALSAGAGEVPRAAVVAVRLTSLVLLCWLAFRMHVSGSRQAAGVGLIIGGGLGNTLDLLLRDHGVVDFIGAPLALELAGVRADLYLVFNTADIAVLIGIGLMAPLIRDWALVAQQRILLWERRWLARLVRRRSTTPGSAAIVPAANR